MERWRRQWREEGLAGVVSKGSPGRPRLSGAQLTSSCTVGGETSRLSAGLGVHLCRVDVRSAVC
ncbi:hypothetical protein AB0F60_30415 [Streptomyces anulatus]